MMTVRNNDELKLFLDTIDQCEEVILITPDRMEYNLNDLPFTYNERSLDAIFLPALHKLCKGVIMTEVRVTRKIKDEDNQTIESNGHVDYWCIYNGYSYAER